MCRSKGVLTQDVVGLCGLNSMLILGGVCCKITVMYK